MNLICGYGGYSLSAVCCSMPGGSTHSFINPTLDGHLGTATGAKSILVHHTRHGATQIHEDAVFGLCWSHNHLAADGGCDFQLYSCERLDCFIPHWPGNLVFFTLHHRGGWLIAEIPGSEDTQTLEQRIKSGSRGRAGRLQVLRAEAVILALF